VTTGLTNDMVTHHRNVYGQNKLIPSRPPSFLWMFIKELMMGFNGVQWIATLFSFLSLCKLIIVVYFSLKYNE
jgi:hypothetical protein